jgi:hypothetical protein
VNGEEKAGGTGNFKSAFSSTLVRGQISCVFLVCFTFFRGFWGALLSFFFRGIWGAVLKAWARSDAVHFGRHTLAGPMDAFRLMKVLNVHCHIMGLKKKKKEERMF